MMSLSFVPTAPNWEQILFSDILFLIQCFKTTDHKIALEAIFVVCRSESIKKIAKENIFHRNVTRVYKFMMQE